MKKLFFLSAMIGLMAGTAAAIEIYSCNTVGVQRVAVKLYEDEVSVPVPFVGIGGQDATLKSLLYIDNLKTGASIQMCQSNKYGFWSVWTVINAFPIMVCYHPSPLVTKETFDGGVTVAVPDEDQCVVPIGVGIKVIRSGVSNIYVMGEYTDKTISTTIKGNSYTYLVNPLNKPFNLDQKLTKGYGVNYRDQIIFTTGTSTKTYYFDDEGEGGHYWYYNSIVIGDGGKKLLVPIYESPEIPAGGGFAYWRRADSALTFAW